MMFPMPDLEALEAMPGAKAYIAIGRGCFAIRYGPYPPATAVGFIPRLMAEHDGPHPFFFTVTLDPIEDPVPELLRMAKDAAAQPAAGKGAKPPPFDEPALRIAVWNALRKAQVAQDSCYRLIDEAVEDYRTFAARVTG
jgi:hypothetical protein